MSGPVLRTAATGLGPIAETFLVPAGATYQVVSVSLNLNLAPTTAENFTVSLDAYDGVLYDVVLYALDLTTGATTDLVWQPNEPFYACSGDAIDVTWANTDGRTWGLLVTLMEV